SSANRDHVCVRCPSRATPNGLSAETRAASYSAPTETLCHGSDVDSTSRPPARVESVFENEKNTFSGSLEAKWSVMYRAVASSAVVAESDTRIGTETVVVSSWFVWNGVGVEPENGTPVFAYSRRNATPACTESVSAAPTAADHVVAAKKSFGRSPSTSERRKPAATSTFPCETAIWTSPSRAEFVPPANH